MSNWLREIIKSWGMSPAEKYLSQATDRIDLENRMNDIKFGKVKFY